MSFAQKAVPAPSVQPLEQMPYSPSLDLTSMDRNIYAKLTNENQQFLRGILDADAKATNRTPVNGVVSNMPEFQKAFGCRMGQPMVHSPACKVW